MSFSLNKIMLIGNLGQDAETRFTTTNISVTSFSLATVNSYKGKEGNWIEETTWHNITSFNLSDYFKNNLKKGRKVYVEGRLQKKEYTDKQGAKKYSVNVISENIIPLDRIQASTPNIQNEPITDEDDDLPF